MGLPAVSQSASGFAHRPALDGLRGLAVLAVVAYHFDALEGGYLGVDLFFVLSGFLITSLMIHEVKRTGTVSLGAFWVRRARRLLPALYVVLLAGALYAAFVASEAELPAIRRDGITGLFYVANWAQITAKAAYFDQYGVPSIFRHLWSLAIEEQFYLVWPLIAGGVLRFARQPVRALGAVSAAGAVASMSAAIWMYVPSTPVERLYFGTDTRAGAILVGAFVACLSELAAGRSVPSGAASRSAANGAGAATVAGKSAGVVRTFVAVLSLAALISCWFWLAGTDPQLWRGGLATCGILAGVLIGIAGSPRAGRLGSMLSVRPLAWFGTVSYGLYLWHWPVRVVLDESRVGLRGPGLFAVRFVISVALATVSFYAIEQPVRRGVGLWRRRSARRPNMPMARAGGRPGVRPARTGLMVAGTSAVIAVALVAATRPPQVTMSSAQVLEQAQSRQVARSDAASKATATTAPPLVSQGEPLRVLVFGDSVGDNIGQGMRSLAKERGFAATSLARVGCPLALVPGRNLDAGQWVSDPPECSKILDRFDQALAEVRPNLAIVSFGSAADFGRELPSGLVVDACTPEYDQWRTETWETLFRHMMRSGVAVAATTVSYIRRYGVDARWDSKTDCLNRSLRDAAESTGARVVDLGQWTCPSKTCIRSLGGVAVRPDGLHYNDQLTPVVASWILSQVVADWDVDDRPPDGDADTATTGAADTGEGSG